MMFKYIDEDIVNMRKDDVNEAQFYWGDKVEIIDQSEAGMRVACTARGARSREAPSARRQGSGTTACSGCRWSMSSRATA